MKATGDVASAHSVRCSERKARAAVDDCATIGVSAESGTARGKVRRIDDLGRVVIPKEIRRTMRIREGDPLDITLTLEEKFAIAVHSILKRYNN